jgi:predicted nucleic acid-binding Zn ribbon protein
MQNESIKPISLALTELVSSLGIKQKLQEYNAVIFWDSVVGKQISKIATAIKIKQGVLVVHVRTSTWRNELMLRKKDIVNKLNAAIGMEAVKDIKFQ